MPKIKVKEDKPKLHATHNEQAGRNKNSSGQCQLSRPTSIPWLSQSGVPEHIVRGMVGVGNGSRDGAITHSQFHIVDLC